MQVAQDQTSLLFIKNNQSGFFSYSRLLFCFSYKWGYYWEHAWTYLNHSLLDLRTPPPPDHLPAPRPLARPVPAERGEIPEHTIDEKQTLFMGKV